MQTENETHYRNFVVELNNRIVGFFNFKQRCHAYIGMIGIDSNYRKRGLARLVLEFSINYLRERNSRTAYLEVRTDNNASISLVESFGFRNIGTRENLMADGCSTYVYSINLK